MKTNLRFGFTALKFNAVLAVFVWLLAAWLTPDAHAIPLVTVINLNPASGGWRAAHGTLNETGPGDGSYTPMAVAGAAFESANEGWNGNPAFNDSSWVDYTPYAYDIAYNGWYPADGTISPSYARRVFTLGAAPTGSFYAQVDDDYQVWVNGMLVVNDDDGNNGPASTTDLAAYVHAGDNVIAVKSHNSYGGGFYSIFRGSVTSGPPVIVVTCPTITLSADSLPSGTTGVSYSQDITASGGSGTYTYAQIDGTLPNGLTLGANGTLSGIPTSAAGFNFTVTATDANGCKGTNSYSLTVNCPIITLSPGSLTTGTVGVSYSETITANGGTAPYSYVTLESSSPSGLTLANDGTLSGIPTDSGAFNFTVMVVDANNCTGFADYTLNVVGEPTVAITSPADGAWFTTSRVTVNGTATPGSTNIARVLFGVNGGAVTNVANGTNTWIFAFDRSGITNVVTVMAQGANGLLSAPVSRTYVYSGPQPLGLKILGNGHVSPASLIGPNLVVGHTYSLTAISNDVNSAFVSWSDNLPVPENNGFLPPVNNPKDTFTMQPGLALTVTFTNNPFVDAAGTYFGLFNDTQNGVAMSSAGWVRIVVDKRWNFTCVLWVNSHPATFTGRFNLAGQGSPEGPVLPNGATDPLTFNIQLNFDDTIDGTVVSGSPGGGSGINPQQDSGWLSSLHAVRAATKLQYTGKYNIVIPGNSRRLVPSFNDIEAPEVEITMPTGDGFINADISDTGLISGAGYLADGLAFHSLATSIGVNGEWPFFAMVGNQPTPGSYVKDYRTLVCGWLQFSDASRPTITKATKAVQRQGTPGLVQGNLTWIKTPSRGLYPNGFTNYPAAYGCSYFGAAPNYPNASTYISGGNLEGGYTFDSSFVGGAFSVDSTNFVDRVQFNPINGTLNGRFNFPGESNQQMRYQSVYLPYYNTIDGFFFGSDQSGLFQVQPYYVAPE